MKLTINFKPNMLSVMIAGALGLAHAPSYASLLNYTLTAETSYEQDANSDSNSDTGPVSAWSNISLYSAEANLWGSASGDSNGWMYSVSSGEGQDYRVDSSITQSVDVQNNSGIDLDYSYDFVINFGSLSAYNWGFTDADEYSQAGYVVEIALNNTTIWASAAELLTDLNGTTANFSGTQWASYSAGSDWFNWGEYSDTLNLGTLSAGSSFHLTYRISTFVAGNHLGCGGIGIVAFDSAGPDCDDGYGYGYGHGFTGSSYAQFGDPNNFNTTPVAFSDDNITGRPTTSVPAPSTALILGAGLAGLAFRRRKNKV